jgi:hypothetical protein
MDWSPPAPPVPLNASANNLCSRDGRPRILHLRWRAASWHSCLPSLAKSAEHSPRASRSSCRKPAHGGRTHPYPRRSKLLKCTSHLGLHRGLSHCLYSVRDMAWPSPGPRHRLHLDLVRCKWNRCLDRQPRMDRPWCNRGRQRRRGVAPWCLTNGASKGLR